MSREKTQVGENIFPDTLRWLRVEILGVETQLQMAQQLGVSPYKYNDWENGRSDPDFEDMMKILRACPDDQTRSQFWKTDAKKIIDNAESADNTGGTEEKAKDRRHVPGARIRRKRK